MLLWRIVALTSRWPSLNPMLLAEDLLLVLTDDETGRLRVTPAEADVALGGALLIELTLAGRVDLTREGETLRTGRLVVRDGSPVGDSLLDVALAIIAAHRGKKPDAVLKPLGKGLRSRLYGRLVERGVLRSEKVKLLGLVPTQTWPAVDGAQQRQLRAQLEQALVTGVPPQQRVAALVSLLQALRSVAKVVPPKQHGIAKRDLERRAKEIAEGDWGSAAVRKAVDAMAAATMAAITAATSAAVISGSA